MIVHALARAWQQDRRLVVGTILALMLVFTALLVPFLLQELLGFVANQQNLTLGATAPCLRHPFGTDFFGRDVAMRTLLGLRVSLGIGLCAAFTAALIGTLYGAVAGYLGGITDTLMMRMVDVLYSLPYMFLVIVLVTVLGTSMVLLFVALGFVGWLLTARIVRAKVIELKQREFILALVGIGASPARIILRHLIPNVMASVLVVFALTVPALIMEEAFLSFLGLGVQAPHASLGSLISDGIETVLIYWWLLVFPAATLALLLVALNLLGDALRNAIDPRNMGH